MSPFLWASCITKVLHSKRGHTSYFKWPPGPTTVKAVSSDAYWAGKTLPLIQKHGQRSPALQPESLPEVSDAS